MRIIQMLIISLMFVSCSSKYNLGGKYLSEDRTEELILDKNNYIYKNIDNITFPFKCCDTISHGTWTKIIKNSLKMITNIGFDVVVMSDLHLGMKDSKPKKSLIF